MIFRNSTGPSNIISPRLGKAVILTLTKAITHFNQLLVTETDPTLPILPRLATEQNLTRAHIVSLQVYLPHIPTLLTQPTIRRDLLITLLIAPDPLCTVLDLTSLVTIHKCLILIFEILPAFHPVHP
jgi:hypothetical protein